MNLKLTSTVSVLMLMAVLLLSGCKSDEEKAAAQTAAVVKATVAATTLSAAAAIENTAKSLRASNLQAVLEASVPPQHLAQMRTEWANKIQEKPITDEHRIKFKENLALFTSPDAEEKMWASLEPELAKLEAEATMKIPVAIAMGQGVLASLVQQREDLNETQKQQMVKAIDALAKWATTAKFTNPVLAQKAIGIVCATARALKLETLDQVHGLSLEQALAKSGIVFKGFKQVLDIYGFSVDQTLDSVKTSILSEQDDHAKVNVNVKLFDSALDFETDMVKLDGRWYGKETLNSVQKQSVENQDITADEPAHKG